MMPTPVDRIASLLESVGYRRVNTPLDIAGLIFDLPMAFIGTAPSPDLILVGDTAFESEHRILKKVEGVARALDVVGSRRPLTAILAGPRPNSTTLNALSRVCRVLPVGSASDDDPDTHLRNWLAVLLPLVLPMPGGGIADPLAEVAQRLEGLEPNVASLVAKAEEGMEAVQALMYQLIAEPVAEFEEDFKP